MLFHASRLCPYLLLTFRFRYSENHGIRLFYRGNNRDSHPIHNNLKFKNEAHKESSFQKWVEYDTVYAPREEVIHNSI